MVSTINKIKGCHVTSFNKYHKKCKTKTKKKKNKNQNAIKDIYLHGE